MEVKTSLTDRYPYLACGQLPNYDTECIQVYVGVLVQFQLVRLLYRLLSPVNYWAFLIHKMIKQGG